VAERQRADADAPKRLEAALRKGRRELERLVNALAEGCEGASAAVLAKIKALEASIEQKQRELDKLQITAPGELEIARTKRAFRAGLDQFNDLLRSDVPLTRQALRKLLDGRIQFLPEQRGGERAYHLRWALRLKPLIDERYIGVASPRGFEPYASDLFLPLVA